MGIDDVSNPTLAGDRARIAVTVKRGGPKWPAAVDRLMLTTRTRGR
jgi:hypothetical protein